MSKEWNKFNAADWVVQNCWEQITGPKPQTHAWLQASNISKDYPPWEIVLDAVDLIVLNRWIEFGGYGYSLSHPGPSSVNEISFTKVAQEDIERQLKESPDSPIRFRG